MSDDLIYENDYLRVTDHDGDRVAVQTGQQPEKATPTLVDAADLRDALDGHLADVEEAIDDA